MPEITALILAAGRGVRMGPRGRMTPKGLLRVGGQALMARSLGLLREAGVARARLVTGHLAEMYHEEIPQDDFLQYVHNPDFAETGSLKSLLTGLEGLQGTIVILESDVIYERRALQAVLDGQTRMVVSGETQATDEVFVWAEDKPESRAPSFRFMSKQRDARPEPHFGELTGITCISADDLPVLKAACAKVYAEDTGEDYETGVIGMSQRVNLPCHLIADLAWTEIDNEDMLARAEAVVWPRIQDHDANL